MNFSLRCAYVDVDIVFYSLAVHSNSVVVCVSEASDQRKLAHVNQVCKIGVKLALGGRQNSIWFCIQSEMVK